MFQRFQYIFIVNKTVKTYAVKRLMDFNLWIYILQQVFYEEKQFNSCDFPYTVYGSL